MSRYTKKYYPDGATATFIDGEFVEGTLPATVGNTTYVMPDLNGAYKGGGYQSPCDGTWIDSRSTLREHNKRNNVMHAGDVSMLQRMENVRKKMDYDPSLHGKVQWTEPTGR